jgi:hypothetical protein
MTFEGPMNLGSWNLGSAHRLHTMNINFCAKLFENSSRGSRYTERTRSVTDRWVGGCMYGWMNVWMDGLAHTLYEIGVRTKSLTDMHIFRSVQVFSEHGSIVEKSY